MYLHKLNLTNVRGLRVAEFDFLGQAGVHLIVGVNGVGKSTTLDALRILLSQLMPQFVATGVRGFSFEKDDITQGQAYLGAQLTGQVLQYPFLQIIDRKAETSVPDKGPVLDGRGLKAVSTPDVTDLYLSMPASSSVTPPIVPSTFPGKGEQDARLKEVQKYLRESSTCPLAVYFSPHRSLINNETAKIGRTQQAAYVEALNAERTFSAKAFADWGRTRQVLATERNDLAEVADLEAVFNRVATEFLTNCQDLQLAPPDDDRQLLITKNGHQLSIRQLSDGERSILTLALELARRLYLANPHLPDPTKQGIAIVLIDELDLHLHPGWQRDVIKRLESTFPACQFIASTHSPQIIGEVQHERVSVVQIQKPQVVHPSQTFGMDSNWIIDVLMDAEPRNVRVAMDIKRLFSLIAPHTLSEAKALLAGLRNEIGLGSSELSRAEASINRLGRTSREKN